MENPKRARSWKQRLQPRVNLKNDEPVLYSTFLLISGTVNSPFTSAFHFASTSPGAGDVMRIGLAADAAAHSLRPAKKAEKPKAEASNTSRTLPGLVLAMR